VTTARRAADAAGSDQVLLVLLKADYTLERLQVWDTLGMRGTHSEGFTLRARAAAEQIVPEPYDKIHAQTMVPFAHLLWGFGVGRELPPPPPAKRRPSFATRGAARMAKCRPVRHTSPKRSPRCGLCAAYWRRIFAATNFVMADEKAISSLEFQAMITLTKVQASELALTTVLSSLRACGLSGYATTPNSP